MSRVRKRKGKRMEMSDDQKRDLMDGLAEAIEALVSPDDTKRRRVVGVLQSIYNCLARDCKGDQHDPS